MSDLDRLVATLRAQPERSRNRHFDELSSPLATRARQVLRRLDGLARELRSDARVEVAPGPHGGVVVTLAWPEMRARRTAYLTDEEHRLLCADPALDERLRCRDGAAGAGPTRMDARAAEAAG